MKKAVLILVLVMLAVSAFGYTRSTKQVDEMTGEEVVTIIMEDVTNGWMFVVRVTDTQSIEMFTFREGVYLGDVDSGMLVKFDAEDPHRWYVNTSTSGVAKFLKSEYLDEALDSLINGYTMVVRVWDYNSTHYTATYDISDFMGEYYKYFGDN